MRFEFGTARMQTYNGTNKHTCSVRNTENLQRHSLSATNKHLQSFYSSFSGHLRETMEIFSHTSQQHCRFSRHARGYGYESNGILLISTQTIQGHILTISTFFRPFTFNKEYFMILCLLDNLAIVVYFDTRVVTSTEIRNPLLE